MDCEEQGAGAGLRGCGGISLSFCDKFHNGVVTCLGEFWVFLQLSLSTVSKRLKLPLELSKSSEPE